MEMECFPYGVGRADEGISLLVQIGPHRVLLDCGLEDISPLVETSKSPADFVLCSHAHADHARGLLSLHLAYPEVPVYGSEATARLLSLNWPGESEIPEFCQPLPWQSSIELGSGLTVKLFPAGHLPGAAAILLTYTPGQRSYKLLYTGDFFLSSSRLVDGLPLGDLRGLRPDVLILEGSYGTARHPHRRQLENHLAERIHQTLNDQISVLLPTPTLGLGQELLMLLRSHHYFTGRGVDIWVDGAVALGCDAYLELLPHFPSNVQNFAQHQPLFWDERVRPCVRRLVPEQLPQLGDPPCILITEENINLAELLAQTQGQWLVLLAQKPGTLSVKDLDELLEQMELAGVAAPKLHSIETYFLTEHCDGPGTTQLIHNIRPQHVVLVHGSPAYLADLTNLDELRNRYQLHSPEAGRLVELPIGETFLQPPVVDTHYEGEIIELRSEVNLTLPNTITTDPRWSQFADTGLIEARWQGEELVLRGLSQRELLSQVSYRMIPTDIECCGNCIYYRGQRCWNHASALFGFKVTPDGYCPAFAAAPESTPAPEGE